MPAYMILMREGPVRDPAAMAEYQRLNRERPAGEFTFKRIIAYGAIEALEGEPPDGIIVLEFPSVAEARAWYGSPGYQATLPHRLKAADYRVFIVEGV